MSPKKKSKSSGVFSAGSTSKDASVSEEKSTVVAEKAPEPTPAPAPKAAAPAPAAASTAVVGPPGVAPGRMLKRGNVMYRVLSILGPDSVRAAIPNSGKIVVLKF